MWARLIEIALGAWLACGAFLLEQGEGAAMQKANLKWDEATLDKWLTKPAAVVPGTSMAFAGLPNAADRANVIAYLKKPVD